MGGVLVAFSSDTKTGCGSQHLRRCRLHLAGRGPNNSSLLRPLAAVAIVAGHSIARPIAFGNRVPPQADGLRRNYQPAARANSKPIK